ncbi:unnamed protein product [Echinostoma caproni]|uniref:Uncharacterized protein n=1 Tax=Echinostoma caproni TaxID=27848 RepID=A0A183AH71_9TREM|nr:unnamed protein product [Echinostoma caproni]
MGDSEFLTNAESTLGQDANKPLTDVPRELSPTYSLEDTVNCVESLDAVISAPSHETFLTSRTSGRTVSTTTTTSAVEYSSLTTSQTCSSIGDSGFSSWTGTVETHSHFSPTLARLDSESQPASDESNAPVQAPNLPIDRTAGLGALCCANALNEELCDRMFVRDLTDPEPPSVPHVTSWSDGENQNSQVHLIPSVSASISPGMMWQSTIVSTDPTLFHPLPIHHSPFRPVKFIEAGGIQSHDPVSDQHQSIVPSSTGALQTSNNTSGIIHENSTTSCLCHSRCGSRRPDSAPVRISQGPPIGRVGFSLYGTDSGSVSEPNDDPLPVDTANDGDDESDTENTPTSRRRYERKQLQHRLSRHSFSGHSYSAFGPSTQSCHDRFSRVRVRDPEGSTITYGNSVLCIRPRVTPRNEFRIEPLWLRRRQVPPSLSTLASSGRRFTVHEQRDLGKSKEITPLLSLARFEQLLVYIWVAN